MYLALTKSHFFCIKTVIGMSYVTSNVCSSNYFFCYLSIIPIIISKHLTNTKILFKYQNYTVLSRVLLQKIDFSSEKNNYIRSNIQGHIYLTLNLLYFLNGIIHLQFFTLSIIIFRDIKFRT